MTVGLPRDPAQWLAAALAVAAILGAGPLVREGRRPCLAAALLALVAAALSAAYVVVYLRGGPRIIDASSYFLQARGFSEGFLSFPVGEPEAAVLGRFLVRSEPGGVPHAAVLFPPGYAAVLALGFLGRAPLAVGPLLAAGIALVTYDLAHRVSPPPASGAPSTARVAMLLSVTCAALRYHTADTMSHGLAALCFAGAITLLLRAGEARSALLAAASGAAGGWLFATRPVSAVALAAVLAYLLVRDPPTRAAARRLVPALLAGAVPGVLFFLVQQRAATGAWLASSQRLYYAVADGPPGCFRYGFGEGVGCLGEHGDFVRARLGSGYGFLAAAGTTLRRLKMHLVDPANLEPLALLVPAGALGARAGTRARALGIAVVAQVLAYVPFYFDGNYPGGGGRFFCDLLPVEHVLAAIAVTGWAARRPSPARWAAGLIAASLLGFAVRAGFDHAALRDRDGGRPFFEPDVLARAGVDRGLVFVDTDHGFDLAFDPGGRGGIAIARYHGDALDRFAWEARGRPPAFRYRFEPGPEGGPAAARVEPLTFTPTTDGPAVVEGESLWPPLAQEGGWALPEWASGTCASADRWLAVHSAAEGPVTVRVGLPAPWIAGRRVSVRLALAGGARGEITLAGHRQPFAAPASADLTCLDLPSFEVPAEIAPLSLTLRADAPGALLALDALRVDPREND